MGTLYRLLGDAAMTALITFIAGLSIYAFFIHTLEFPNEVLELTIRQQIFHGLELTILKHPIELLVVGLLDDPENGGDSTTAEAARLYLGQSPIQPRAHSEPRLKRFQALFKLIQLDHPSAALDDAR
jgi:hypothetical protein